MEEGRIGQLATCCCICAVSLYIQDENQVEDDSCWLYYNGVPRHMHGFSAIRLDLQYSTKDCGTVGDAGTHSRQHSVAINKIWPMVHAILDQINSPAVCHHSVCCGAGNTMDMGCCTAQPQPSHNRGSRTSMAPPVRQSSLFIFSAGPT